MDTMKDVVGKLNELLTVEVLDDQLLAGSVNQFNALCELKNDGKDGLPESSNDTIHQGIVWMDFETYTEEKQEQVRLLKLEKITEQNFELAANMRDVEKECITYLRFKKHYGLEKSTFVIIDGFLIYAYFGNARNDQLIRDYLLSQEGFKSMKIDV